MFVYWLDLERSGESRKESRNSKGLVYAVGLEGRRKLREKNGADEYVYEDTFRKDVSAEKSWG